MKRSLSRPSSRVRQILVPIILLAVFASALAASSSSLAASSPALAGPPGPATPLSPGLTVETRTSGSGALESRVLTPADGLPAWTVPSAEEPGTPRDDGSILWIDRNHQNAVCENVAITGDGAYGIAGWWLNAKRVALYRVDNDNVPEWTHSMVAQFQIPVAADRVGAAMPATGRGDPLYVFQSSSSVPVFQDGYSGVQMGYRCSVSNSGNTIASGGGNPDGTSGELRVYDGSGALRFKRSMTAPPEGVCVSPDGLVVSCNVRAYVKVWDAVSGAFRDSVAIPGEAQLGAVLSGDGSLLAIGGFYKTVRLYQWDGAHYVQLWSYNIPSTTWITALALSENGATLAVGTWTNPTGGKVLLFNTGNAVPLWTDSSYGDWVSAVAVSSDGLYIAAGSWGRSGGTVGNIISFYDRYGSMPLWGVADDALAGVGSCMSLDLSDDGAYVFAGGKAIHAREMGSGGFTIALRMVTGAVSDEGPRASDLRAWPNPSCSDVRLDLSGPAATASAIRIISADGRLVRSHLLENAERAWTWDGRDEGGRPAGPGVYFARVSGSGALAPEEVRLTRLR